MADDLWNRIAADYPQLVWMLGIPEVGALITQAVDPYTGFNANAFEAKLAQTEWWRTTPASARAGITKQNTDPATWQADIEKTGSDVFQWAQRMGVTMTMPEYHWFRTSFELRGLDVNSSQAQIELTMWLNNNRDRIGYGGAIYGAAQHAANVSRSEYFVDRDTRSMLDYGIALATGTMDDAGMRQQFTEWSAALNPHLAPRLKAGETMAQIVNPYREIVAKELELGSLEAVDMMNSPEWKWLIGKPGEDGQMRLPTQQEVMEAARSKPEWWQTTNGRATDASFTQSLLQTLGKVA